MVPISSTLAPLTLTGFYERDQISNPGAGSYLGTTKKDWMLLGAYDFGVVKPFVSYGQAKADNSQTRPRPCNWRPRCPWAQRARCWSNG